MGQQRKDFEGSLLLGKKSKQKRPSMQGKTTVKGLVAKKMGPGKRKYQVEKVNQ